MPHCPLHDHDQLRGDGERYIVGLMVIPPQLVMVMERAVGHERRQGQGQRQRQRGQSRVS